MSFKTWNMGCESGNMIAYENHGIDPMKIIATRGA